MATEKEDQRANDSSFTSVFKVARRMFTISAEEFRLVNDFHDFGVGVLPRLLVLPIECISESKSNEGREEEKRE